MMQTLPNFESATDSLPELIRHLRHRLVSTRLAAVKALGKLGWQTGESVAALSSSLNDEDELVRESAAQAIGQLGPNAVSAMIRMLNNKDKYVRRHAVWALGKLGPKAVPAIATLCQSLKDADPRTATGAAQALGEIGSEGAPAVAELAIAMRGTNVVLCRLAAKALSQIGMPALPTLLVHLAHHDPFIKAEAAMAVGWMGPKAEAAIPKLVEILNLPAPRYASSNASGNHRNRCRVRSIRPALRRQPRWDEWGLLPSRRCPNFSRTRPTPALPSLKRSFKPCDSSEDRGHFNPATIGVRESVPDSAGTCRA